MLGRQGGFPRNLIFFQLKMSLNQSTFQKKKSHRLAPFGSTHKEGAAANKKQKTHSHTKNGTCEASEMVEVEILGTLSVA